MITRGIEALSLLDKDCRYGSGLTPCPPHPQVWRLVDASPTRSGDGQGGSSVGSYQLTCNGRDAARVSDEVVELLLINSLILDTTTEEFPEPIYRISASGRVAIAMVKEAMSRREATRKVRAKRRGDKHPQTIGSAA